MTIGQTWSPALRESLSSTFGIVQDYMENEFKTTDFDVEGFRVIRFE